MREDYNHVNPSIVTEDDAIREEVETITDACLNGFLVYQLAYYLGKPPNMRRFLSDTVMF